MSNLMKRKRGNFLDLFNNEFPTPWSEMVDKVFHDEWPDFGNRFGLDFFERQAYPRINLIDNKENFVIEAEIPGLTKEDVKINTKDDVLTISGKKRSDDSEESKNYIKREIKQSSFRRSFGLNDLVEIDKIEAKFDNNTLLIILPKKEKAKDLGFTEVEIK